MAKILFVQNYDNELIGISSIASYIKPRHEAAVAFGNKRAIIERFRSFAPDVVGISLLTKDHNGLYDKLSKLAWHILYGRLKK